MTTYETMAMPGQLTPPAPLDPAAVHQLARHALDVLIPTAVGAEAEPPGEAAGQLAIALCTFARLVEADPDDQLAESEAVVEGLHRASLHTARLPATDHLIVRDGLHELARLLAPLARGSEPGGDQ